MTKVWKSVGAVSIYSPGRAAAIVAGLAVLLAALGFGIGLLVGGGDSEAATDGVRTVTQTETSEAPPPSEDEAGNGSAREERRAAYRRGYEAGAAAGLTEAGDFQAGQAYVIRFGGTEGAPSVAQSVRVRPGQSYYLCEGATRLCIEGR